LKWFRKPSKNKNVEEIYERCVICGELTEVLRETPINERDFYVVGCGQLCFTCYRRTGEDPELQITDASMECLLDCCRKDTQK